MKKKLLSMLLAMSMVVSVTACGKAPESNASSQAASSVEASSAAGTASAAGSADQAAGGNAESQAAGEKAADVVITDEKIKTILLAMSEQMQDDPSMLIDMYTVKPDQKEVYKAMVMQVAENEKLTYVKMGTPLMQMELYKQADGHLYVDLSVDQVEEGTDTSGTYFDGTRYHQLMKAEPKEEAEDSVSDMEEFMDNPAEDIDENTEFKVYDQTKIGENTVVAVAFKNEEEEQHMLVYLKGEQVEKLVASSAKDKEDEKDAEAQAGAASPTEAYAVVYLKPVVPASVPEYFNTVEFTDADEVNSAAAFGLMGILFSAMGAGDDSEENIAYTGEWAANAGDLAVSEAEEIKTLLDLNTVYFK